MKRNTFGAMAYLSLAAELLKSWAEDERLLKASAGLALRRCGAFTIDIAIVVGANFLGALFPGC